VLDGARGIPANHLRGAAYCVNGEAQCRKALQFGKLRQLGRKRAQRVITLADRDEFEPFRTDAVPDIRHLKEGHAMSACLEFSCKS
jgi:hypothetical protein